MACTISAMGRICFAEVTELATNATSRMMALSMKNRPINDRHISISDELSMTASTSPSTFPVSLVMGTLTANFFCS